MSPGAETSSDHVVDVGEREDPRHDLRELDAGAVGHAPAVRGRRAARGREADALVEGGVEEGRISAVGVPEHADARRVDRRVLGERRQRGGGVAQHGRHQ
jgi:hypothetical protein